MTGVQTCALPIWRVHAVAAAVLPTQHVLAELGGVDPAAAGRRHAEALQEEALQHLGRQRHTGEGRARDRPGERETGRVRARPAGG